MQLTAYGATARWLWAALQLVESRQQAGRLWAAAALILGAVVLVTLVAGLLMNSRCMRERYPFYSLPSLEALWVGARH